MKKLLNANIYLLMLFLPIITWANSQVSISLGGYSISGKNGNRTTEVSGLGAYRLGLSHNFTTDFQLKIGYNVTFESIISGDSIYGLDIGASWLFWGPQLFESFKSDGVLVKITREWSPYLGFQFNQRQFQSNKSNYSGFGAHIGAHFPIQSNLSWHSEVRYNLLTGPNNATATDSSILLGVSRDF